MTFQTLTTHQSIRKLTLLRCTGSNHGAGVGEHRAGCHVEVAATQEVHFHRLFQMRASHVAIERHIACLTFLSTRGSDVLNTV